MVPVHSVSVGELTERITLTVRGLNGFRLRLWIARQLFALGAKIAGVNIVMEVGRPGDDG